MNFHVVEDDYLFIIKILIIFINCTIAQTEVYGSLSQQNSSINELYVDNGTFSQYSSESIDASEKYVPIHATENISIKLSKNNNLTLHKSTSYNFRSLNSNQVPFVATTAAPPADTNHAGNYNVIELVRNLDVRLKNIRNVELGVTIVQEIFDAMDFTRVIRNDTETALKIAKRMSKKLQKAVDAIDSLSTFIEDNITSTIPSRKSIFLNTLIQPCPFEDFSLEQNYNKQQIEILNYLKNNGHHDENDVNFTANAQLVEEMRLVNTDSLNFKHFYFLSHSDHASDHNCQYYFNDLHFRHLYVSAIKKKHIFLLIDNGNSLSSEQLGLSKIFASNIINMLSDTDSFTVAVISNKAYALTLNHIEPSNNAFRYSANMDNKEEISEILNNLNRSAEATNHTVGFKFSFLVLHKQNIPEDVSILFVYISRGLISRSNEAVLVLEEIAAGQRLLKNPIKINTCVIILDEKRVMYEKQFLRAISEQNYTKYNVNVSDWYNEDVHDLQGEMFTVTKRHPERIIKTSSSVFENLFLNGNVSTEMEFHLPVLDYNTKDVIISITKSVESYGVVGVNMYLNDLAEDIIYFKPSDDVYAFLIDVQGLVIFHPAFPRPVAISKNPFPVDIIYLEAVPHFEEVRQEMLNQLHGNRTIVEKANETTTYTWRRVLDAYIVCIVTKISVNARHSVRISGLSPGLRHYQQHNEYISPQDLLYHRIDLIPPQTPVCRHFRQIATLDSGTVFLSASSFQSPFVYIKNNREMKDDVRTHNAQSIMAYIKDVTNLLANPGLQPEIRNDVSALFHVMSYLKKRHQEGGAFKKYIIRRYVATTSGIIQIYPGCILGSNLEPTRRPWFKKAMKHSGKIILTEPYLDAGGAGYIVTIAHTIFEGKANALHNAERDVPVAIVAIDVPYGFFYKLILDSASFCSDTNIKCLLMEDEGYLVGHPSFLEPATKTQNSRRPLEHITHKESFVANDILNHKNLVQKRACANYQNRTIQRYYTFNTSLNAVLTNVVHGERTKYQITAIKGTNLFVAVLNSTCDGGAFCPCSTVDRICLNCNRMDQTDCECPCECPLHITSTYNAHDEISLNTSRQFDYCEPPTECLSVVNSLSYDWDTVLKSCVNINCDLYTTQNDCLGVMGCEWCQLDMDGNIFSSPFCTAQSSCFNGVLGSMTPYGDGDLGPAVMEPVMPPAYSAIGPVGGAIIALCIVVGFAMYCYRQNLDSASEQLYGESLQEENYGVPLSRFNFDDVSPHDDSDLSGTGGNVMHRNLLHPLANAIAVSDISPYHMSSGGYRRPNGESDHGYSTMTPHEDSEHMCFTLVEPLISNKRLSMSDSMSINTSVSSPTNQNQLIAIDKPIIRHQTSDLMTGQTLLPEQLSPHHIVAPVTVHRHMEAS